MEKEQLIEYVKGTLSDPKEVAVIEKWINQHDENKQYLIRLKNLWALSRQEDPSINVEEELERIKGKIQRSKIRHIIKQGLRYAAVLVLLMGIGYVIAPIFKPSVKNYRVYCSPGNILKVEMPDGSLVWLNSGSTLRYNSLYDQKQREVLLSGEGYFQVKKNKAKPFIVKASDLNIKVTGTQFNVVAYPGSHSVQTILSEGSVELFNKTKTVQHKLTPNHSASFNETNNNLSIAPVNAKLLSSWRQGLLTFQNATITEIAQRLGYWYNVKVTIRDPEIRNLHLSCAAVRNKPITLVLESIHLLESRINYQIIQQNGQQEILLTK